MRIQKTVLSLMTLTFSGIGTTALGDELDTQVKELKEKGFDVEVVEKKIKVYSDEEYKKQSEEEQKRRSEEIKKLVEFETSYNEKVKERDLKVKSNQNEIDNTKVTIEKIKEENERIIKKWIQDNEDIKKRNLEKDNEYNTRKENIERDYQEKLTKYKEEVKRLEEANKKNDDDYAKKLADYNAKKDALEKDYERKVKETEAKNKEIDARYDVEVKRINDANAKKRADYEREEAEVREFNKQVDEFNKNVDKQIETNTNNNAELQRQREFILEENRVALENYNREKAEIEERNRQKLVEYNEAKERIERENRESIEANKIERESIQAENDRLRTEYEAKKQEYNAEVAKLAEYNKDVEKFNVKKTEVEKLPIVNQNNGLELRGTDNHRGNGTVGYYDNFKFLTNREDVETVDGHLQFNDNSEIINLTGGIKYKDRETQGNYTYPTGSAYAGRTYRQYILDNLKQGSTFTLTNVGRTKSGRNINMKFTLLKDYTIASNKETLRAEDPSWLVFDQSGGNKTIGITAINTDGFYAHVDFVDDNGEPINLATMNINSDIDYGQGLGFKFTGPNASTVNYNSNMSQLRPFGIRDIEHYVDYATNWNNIHTYNGLNSTPQGTFLTGGVGTGFDVSFLVTDKEYRNIRGMEWKSNQSSFHQNYLATTTGRDKILHNYQTERAYYRDYGSYFDMFGSSNAQTEIVAKPKKPRTQVDSPDPVPPTEPQYKDLPTVTTKELPQEPTPEVVPPQPTPKEVPSVPGNVEVPPKKERKKEVVEPTYENLPEKENYLEKPQKEELPEKPKRTDVDSPEPTPPTKDELPPKPNHEELLERPKEKELPKVPEKIVPNEIVKDKVVVEKLKIVQYRNSSDVGTTVRRLEPVNKRSSSANTLTIRTLK